MSSPQMMRMFGFLSELLVAGLDCFVCANEFAIEPVKKIAAINAANIVITEELNLNFIKDLLSSYVE